MFKHIIKTLCLISILNVGSILSQQIKINKIEPPNWWTGMKHDTVQLMIYGENLKLQNASSSDLQILNYQNVNNHNYTFVEVVIQPETKTGKHTITLTNDYGNAKFEYPVLKRMPEDNKHNGFSNKDVIYLLMPDRFANGDTSNDKIKGFNDSFEGNYTQGRHGGDIKGVINKLPYLKDLGITAIWLTPLVENNTNRSYHGYAATDLYKIDPRFGTISDYKNLVNQAHELGLKIVYDHVSNHISIDHPWMKNLPTNTWVNGTEKKHLNAIHNKMAFADPHSDSLTIKKITRGWFVDVMPDLNQRDSYLSKYLIQNLIWWIETAGVDGVREDTYPYVNPDFSAKLVKEIIREYPKINIVGEVWTGESAFIAGFQKNSKIRKSFNTHLPSVTDFALRDAFYHFLKGKSIYEIYNTLAKDNLYSNPNNLLVFIDNHDIERTMFIANQKMEQAKLAYLLLLTTRGIPQILYGSEIGMVGNQDQGTLRIPFPGGFIGDTHNAFSVSGRTEYENDIFIFLKKLLHLRKQHSALSTGELTHFPPHDEVYVYIKKSEDEKILILVNNSNNTKKINLSNYFPVIKTLNFTDLISNETIKLNADVKIDILRKNFLILKLN